MERGNGSKPKLRIVSSKQFVADFEPPDYLIDGVVMRRFLYSLTGRTGKGKTSIALLIAMCKALGRPLGDHRMEKGRVLYFAGENPDDVRMRWLAMSEHLKFDVDTIGVHFIAGTGSISSDIGAIDKRVRDLRGVDLVIIDTNAAYFEGDNENDNVGAGGHWRMLRDLLDLEGGPCVISLCHPHKSASDDALLPRGAGAVIAEVDGNLTCVKEGDFVRLHWFGKHRGPSFDPLHFELSTVTAERVKDSKGRHIPTVIARALNAEDYHERASAAESNNARVLAVMRDNPGASMRDIAKALGWVSDDGQPQTSKVHRVVKKLLDGELVVKRGTQYELTAKGEKTAGTPGDDNDDDAKRSRNGARKRSNGGTVLGGNARNTGRSKWNT
jgi:hypothetical protein